MTYEIVDSAGDVWGSGETIQDAIDSMDSHWDSDAALDELRAATNPQPWDEFGNLIISEEG